jgi:hypothetical protein
MRIVLLAMKKTVGDLVPLCESLNSKNDSVAVICKLVNLRKGDIGW